MKGILLACIIAITALFASVNNAAAQCGTTNRAASHTTTASSSDALVGSAAAAVDGDISTYWKPIGNNNAQWLYVDLGSSYKICKVIIKWGRWNAPSAFKLEVTNTDPTQSGVTWTEIDNVTTNPSVGPGDAYVYHDQVITSNLNSRYLRLYIPNVSASDNLWVKELEVFSEVVNQAPSITLTSPSGNVSVPTNTAVLLAANASDPDPGNSVTVQFFRDATLIDQAPQTASPYSITWTPTVAGTYVITAKATDNNSATTTSSSVTVTVTAASANAWGLRGNPFDANATEDFLGTTVVSPLIFKTNSLERMRIMPDGKIGIKTNNPPADFSVKGDIWAMKIKVTTTNWPDYVFDSTYKLLSLQEVEKFIRQNKHLPGVLPAKDVEKDGLNLGDGQSVLLRKIEEITLYMIEQDKRIKELEAQLKKRNKR
jgi:hypothetical protein